MSTRGLYLNCTTCGEFQPYANHTDDPDGVVRCDVCGKRHSDYSIWFVDPDRDFERNDSGTLLETPY